jgi:uncharacterized damage-inducible protein DinB
MATSGDSGLAQIRRLWQHSFWADRLMLAGLRKTSAIPPDALREFSHVIGTQETWLSRVEGRASSLAIWPTLTLDELSVTEKVIDAYDAFLSRLTPTALSGTAHYANTKGQVFDTVVGDILMHVAMHSQYHRGKVNVHLRVAGKEPIPTDFITWVRGVPAATSR